MSETPNKDFGEKIKEFFKNPKKVIILVTVLIFIAVGIYLVIDLTKKKKGPTPSPPGPGPGPGPPGVKHKYYCSNLSCIEDSDDKCKDSKKNKYSCYDDLTTCNKALAKNIPKPSASQTSRSGGCCGTPPNTENSSFFNLPKCGPICCKEGDIQCEYPDCKCQTPGANASKCIGPDITLTNGQGEFKSGGYGGKWSGGLCGQCSPLNIKESCTNSPANTTILGCAPGYKVPVGNPTGGAKKDPKSGDWICQDMGDGFGYTYSTKGDPCPTSKTSYWDGVLNNECYCYTDCPKEQFCQILDNQGNCIYPPKQLIEGPNPILHMEYEAGDPGNACVDPSTAEIETACTNCNEGTPSSHCSAKPPLVWEKDIEMCVDQITFKVIQIQLDSSEYLNTSQISGTFFYSLQGGDTSTENFIYTYKLSNKSDSYMGIVHLNGPGDPATCATLGKKTPAPGVDIICEKFFIIFDTENPPKSGQYTSFSINIMYMPQKIAEDYYARYLTAPPLLSINLQPSPPTPGITPQLAPILSKQDALTVACCSGEEIITSHGGNPKAASTKPCKGTICKNPTPTNIHYMDSNDVYVICPAINDFNIAGQNTNNMIIIIAWNPIISTSLSTEIQKYITTNNAKIFYKVQIKNGTTWTGTSQIDTWYSGTTTGGNNNLYRIMAWVSKVKTTGIDPIPMDDYNTATYFSPLIYLNASIPQYTGDICRQISSGYSLASTFDSTAIPNYLVEIDGICTWPTDSTSKGIKYKDSYCMFESSDRKSSTGNNCSPKTCVPGYYNPKAISLYDKSLTSCVDVSKNLPIVSSEFSGETCNFSQTDSSENKLLGAAFGSQNCILGVMEDGQKPITRTLTCPTSMNFGSGLLSSTSFNKKIGNVKTYLENASSSSGIPQKEIDAAKDDNFKDIKEWSKNYLCCPLSDTQKNVTTCIPKPKNGTGCSKDSDCPTGATCDTSDNECWWNPDAFGVSVAGDTTNWDNPGGEANFKGLIRDATCYQDNQPTPVHPSNVDCLNCQYSYNTCGSWESVSGSSLPTWTQGRQCWNVLAENLNTSEEVYTAAGTDCTKPSTGTDNSPKCLSWIDNHCDSNTKNCWMITNPQTGGKGGTAGTAGSGTDCKGPMNCQKKQGSAQMDTLVGMDDAPSEANTKTNQFQCAGPNGTDYNICNRGKYKYTSAQSLPPSYKGQYALYSGNESC